MLVIILSTDFTVLVICQVIITATVTTSIQKEI